MAKLEITISRKGHPVAHETFEISTELAQDLIAKLEVMMAELPGHHRTARTSRPNGATIVEIQLNRDMPSPMVRPNFEELFRQKSQDDA